MWCEGELRVCVCVCDQECVWKMASLFDFMTVLFSSVENPWCDLLFFFSIILSRAG